MSHRTPRSDQIRPDRIESDQMFVLTRVWLRFLRGFSGSPRYCKSRAQVSVSMASVELSSLATEMSMEGSMSLDGEHLVS